MSKSRWGGFLKGRKTYLENWSILESDSNINVSQPTDPVSFDYTTAQGIWNLNSTVQFKKGNTSSGGGGGGGTPPPNYTVGLSPSLHTTSGDRASYALETVDISDYAGATVRLVYEYIQVAAVFTADLQIDNINIDGNIYSFENVSEGFETSSSNVFAYDAVSWVVIDSVLTAGRWDINTGNTGSAGTGNLGAQTGSYYIYTETSSPGNVVGYKFWLRSPQITLSSSPTLTYYEGRQGTSLGTINVYLDVIA